MKLIVNWIFPILCALYLSLVIGQHFAPTAFRYLFLGLLFFFIGRLYLRTFAEKGRDTSLNKKVLIASVIVSAVIVGIGGHYLVPEVIRINRVANVTITALGKKNDKSQGYEAWLIAVKNNGSMDLKSLPLDSGWKSKDNSVYAADKFPATLHIKLEYLSKDPSLVFTRHGWSGMVQVTNGQQQDIIDLYSNTQSEYKYHIDTKQAQVLNDSMAQRVIGYILSFLFYTIIFYFVFIEFGGKKKAGNS